jgi:hypothetical protein
MNKKKDQKRYVHKSIKKSKPIHKKKVSVKKTPIAKSDVFVVVPSVSAPKKKRRPKTYSIDKMYFTEDTQNAIIEYNKEEDHDKREIIYNSRIKYAIEKLVENVFNTFKFSYFETGPLEAQKEAVTHLASNIDKYDPNRLNKKGEKCKAFSYLSVMAKNYLIAENNKNYIRFGRHEHIGEDREEHTVQLQCEDKHHKNAEMNEFMRLMVEFWENNVNKIFTKQRDLDIANAVIELFRQKDRIDAFNKKALYLYIREISSCKTQQITKVINKMKQYQSNISHSYINDGSINTESYMKV